VSDEEDYDWTRHRATEKVLAHIGLALIATSKLASTALSFVLSSLRGADPDIARLVLQKQTTSGVLVLIKGITKTPLLVERDPQLAKEIAAWAVACGAMLAERNDLAHGTLFVGEDNNFTMLASGIKANPLREIDADRLSALTSEANDLDLAGVQLLFRFHDYLDSVGIVPFQRTLPLPPVDG
jgi:hypothetical protein